MIDMIETRSAMVDWIESESKLREGYLEFTKRDMYEGIGLSKPTEEFNRAWYYLCTAKAEFMAYDKDTKTWVWL